MTEWIHLAGLQRWPRIPAMLMAAVLAALPGLAGAGAGQVYRCANGEEVHRALEVAGPGDTVLLEGGRVYEIDRSFRLKRDGTAEAPIRFTSEDPGGQGRFAVITTVDGRKEPNLKAIMVTGSYWNISSIEISGRRVPLGDGWWDTYGFQLGLYLLGPGSHHNTVEDVHIHHTHNAAVAVRNEAHHISFRRMRIHHIGEWLDADYNAHEGEGFYLGSSKGFDEEGNKALIHDVLIEDSIIGPGLLGQYVDIKYGTSAVTVRNNVFHCEEKSYNEEIISLAGFENLIEHNRFVGSNETLTRYVRIFNKKTRVPVRVDYKGQRNVPAPTGRDNSVVNNEFLTDDPNIVAILNEVSEGDRASIRIENNLVKPLDKAGS